MRNGVILSVLFVACSALPAFAYTILDENFDNYSGSDWETEGCVDFMLNHVQIFGIEDGFSECDWSKLRSPAIDLTAANRAVLSFRHFLIHFSQGYSYVYVRVKYGNNQHQDLMVYRLPGIYGDMNLILDLTPFVGQEIQIEWFVAQYFWYMPSFWVVDDIKVSADAIAGVATHDLFFYDY